MMSKTGLERVVFEICNKIAVGLGEKATNAEWLEEYQKIVVAISDIRSNIPSQMGYVIETVSFGETVYELEILESDEETTLHASREEAEECAPKDGRAYLIHESTSKEALRVIDLSGNELEHGVRYATYEEAVMAYLRECVPEWNMVLEHLEEVARPIIFSAEWEEKLKQRSREERAVFGNSLLTEEVLAANYVHRLIMEARKG